MSLTDPDPELDSTRDEVAHLLEEIPRLLRLKAFAQTLGGYPFFGRAGEPLDEGDRALCRAYLDALGFPDAEPALVESWADAHDAALVLDTDPAGWEAEEMLRVAATAQALEHLDEEALQTGLALVAEKAGEAARDALDQAAALYDVEDEGLVRAAAGAIAQAANGAALALVARPEDQALDAPDEDPSPLLDRFRLMARGRWPIGLAGLTLNIL